MLPIYKKIVYLGHVQNNPLTMGVLHHVSRGQKLPFYTALFAVLGNNRFGDVVWNISVVIKLHA